MNDRATGAIIHGTLFFMLWHLTAWLFRIRDQNAQEAPNRPEKQPVDRHCNQRRPLERLVRMKGGRMHNIVKGKQNNIGQGIEKTRKQSCRVCPDQFQDETNTQCCFQYSNKPLKEVIEFANGIPDGTSFLLACLRALDLG